MCDRCGKVHFIAAALNSTEFHQMKDGVYLIRCKVFCGSIIQFRETGIHPYKISEYVFRRGYAERGNTNFWAEHQLRLRKSPESPLLFDFACLCETESTLVQATAKRWQKHTKKVFTAAVPAQIQN